MTAPKPEFVPVRVQDGRIVELPLDWIEGKFPKGTFKIRRVKLYENTPEGQYRARLSAARLGMSVSEETRQKLRAKKVSEETRAKISATWKAKRLTK